MSLAFVSAADVRCLEKAELELGAGLNLIWGPNGSGKTSVLEAIFLLGRGRSFRTRNTERLIRHGAPELVVFGRTLDSRKALGLRAARGSPTIGKIEGAFVSSLAELSRALPVQIIDPSVHKLVEESAAIRRRWMDWAVFHVEPGFVDTWTRYNRALRQRNAALRGEPAHAVAWNAELVRLGEALAVSRSRSIERLQPHWSECVQSLMGRDVELTYAKGWARDSTLTDALAESWARDQAHGITHAGPHRGDVRLRIDGLAAREIASRGQQKLIAVAMILAQLKMLREVFATDPLLLLDDPAAELDPHRLAAFIDLVVSLRCQLVLTSVRHDSRMFTTPERVFHVEQGRVRPV